MVPALSGGNAMSHPAPAPTLHELARASLTVGCLGFGGPAGQIALMHRVFVEEKRWIEEPRYLHALNFCMLLPGPEAQQLATYVGWLLHGVRGGLVAGLLFVLPGALLMLALSWLYVRHGQSPAVAAAFLGVKAAVLAFLLDALLRIGRRALRRRGDGLIAAASFLALLLLQVPFPLLILAAGLVGLLGPGPATDPAAQTDLPVQARPHRAALRSALAWSVVWLAPWLLVLGLCGPQHVLSEIAALFSQLAVLSFGGAYAVLAWLQQQAVSVHGWLTPLQMLDGLGLAETTPGPLILVNQFVGFLAGFHHGGLGLALLAGLLASWCTFAPSFLWIFAGAPYAEALRRNARAAAALRAVSAAVLGVISCLALWFGQAVLFAASAAHVMPWGGVVRWPAPASFDPLAGAIAVLAAIALIRFRAHPVLVVLGSALLGWCLRS